MNRKVLLVLSLLTFSIRADPEKEASLLFEQHPSFPATKESLEGAVRDKAPEYINSQPSKTLQELSTLFEENRDSAKKDLDPIRSLLGSQIKAQENGVKDKNSPLPSLSEVEGLSDKKHRYRLSKDDPIFLGHQKVQVEKSKQDNPIVEQAKAKFGSSFDKRSEGSSKEISEEILTCREGATGTVQSCVKRLVLEAVPQEPIVKNVTAYFTARCYNLVSFGINLKTGHIHTWQCENPGPSTFSVTNPIGEPELPLETRIELISRQHFGEGGVDFRTSQMSPSLSNGFTAVFTAFQPRTGKKDPESNKNTSRGGQYIWRVTLPRKPKLIARWEGCEDLERKQELEACTLGENIQKGVQESRKIEGFPDLVKQDFWEEERQYLCGFGTHKNDCEKLAQQGCEQVGSKCVIEKAGICLEFEQTYQCGKSGFQASGAVPGFEEPFNLNKQPQNFEQYNLADFGMAMTHFHALKEMRSEMKDGLGGMGGSSTNPTIFHGKSERCTIKGGKFIQDCCHLKGILQNILGGGCRESEKLATAHLREKRCHLVQKRYCSHQVKLGLAKVCVEWKDAYCCYGSELARIIQEIAHDDPLQTALRAYNSAHGIETGWGSGPNPNCQSLTASQLSLIHFNTPFAQQHLGQLFKAFEQQAESKLKAIEEKAQSEEGMTARAKKAIDGLKRHFSATHKGRPHSSFRESSK